MEFAVRALLRASLTAILAGTIPSAVPGQTARWPEQKANAWYAQLPWLVGSNHVPRSPINQLEMWQEGTFNEATAALKRVLWEGTEHWRGLLAARARLSGTLVASASARQAIERLSS
jgi:hypothetical protein